MYMFNNYPIMRSMFFRLPFPQLLAAPGRFLTANSLTCSSQYTTRLDCRATIQNGCASRRGPNLRLVWNITAIPPACDPSFSYSNSSEVLASQGQNRRSFTGLQSFTRYAVTAQLKNDVGLGPQILRKTITTRHMSGESSDLIPMTNLILQSRDYI